MSKKATFVLDLELKPFASERQWEILETWSKVGTARKAAEKLGISKTTVLDAHARVKDRRKRGVMPEKQPAEPTGPVVDPKVLRLQGENTRLKNELRALHKENMDTEEIRQTIFGLAKQTPLPPEWLSPKRSTSTGIAGVPSTIWSDWHLGETVFPEQVNGINEFNLSIADQRINRLVDRTIDLCFQHMTGSTYPGIVVACLGDLISGMLHPELEATDEEEILPTILWAVGRIVSALKRLADDFGFVYVPCAFGNHGRIFDRKPRMKNYVYRNADWLIMCLVERELTGDKRFTFQIKATGEAFWGVYNHRYMGVHGDDLGVRGGDGIIGAIGPIMRGEIKMRTSSAQIGRDYDTLLMGHWHQMLWLPRAIVNNTLKGFDEYARRALRAIATPPSQALWFTHPKYGITARWEVYLGEKQSYQVAPWVSWSEDGPNISQFMKGE